MATHPIETQAADALSAEFKFRVSQEARDKLESITARKQRANSGIRLSDTGREAMSEYIERHRHESPSAAPLVLQEEPAFRERRGVARRSPRSPGRTRP